MSALRTLATGCLIVTTLAACSTPESRIKEHRAAFDSYSYAVQEKIRAGQADIGFTEEQVEIALGKPDRIYQRRAVAATQEVWAYAGGSGRTRLGMGYGYGTGYWEPGYAGGMGLALEDDVTDDRLRVVFENGTVVLVEDRRKR